MTEKVNTTWELEREHAERAYTRHEAFTLDLGGVFSYSPPTRDDPGESRLELEWIMFQGSPFELTADEEAAIIRQWGEELRNGE